MTKPKPKDQLQKKGRKSLFREEYILIAKAAARFGAIEEEIADELNIGITTLERWKRENPEFRRALNVGKQAADDRVERSLYQRANGYDRGVSTPGFSSPRGSKSVLIVRMIR